MATKESAARIFELGSYTDTRRSRHGVTPDGHAASVHSVASKLLGALDSLDHCVGLGDRAGKLHHPTRGLAQLVADDLVRAEVGEFVRYVWALAVATRLGPANAPAERRTVDLKTGTYQFTGTFIGLDLFGLGATVLVGITPPVPDPLRPERLQQRFGLTRAQVRVARLLALGLRNDEIGTRLFLSSHTVRHHIEQIRDKVGGHTRAAVAAKLREEV